MSSSLPHTGNDSNNRTGFGRRNRRSTSDIPSKEGRRWALATAFASSKKTSNSDKNTFPGSSSSFVDPTIAINLQRLQRYTLKIRNATKNVSHVDSAWDEYLKHRDGCFECCKTLITPPSRRRELSVVSPTTVVSPRPEGHVNLSFDTLNLAATDTNSSTQSFDSRADAPPRSRADDEQCQKAAREWQSTIENLANTLRTSLQETYNEHQNGATAEDFEKMCENKSFRHNSIYHMRIASISKMMSADLNFFPRYDVRFRNYDEIKRDLVRLRSLLDTSGNPKKRTVIERNISPTGDVILEFANLQCEEEPIFRFRVSSHCLRETSSPIFRRIFNGYYSNDSEDDIRHSLPPSPTHIDYGDHNKVLLYKMPQTELNTQRSLEILLHAAHNHNHMVPREVQFSQFAAIAEACLRYQCTSPLELVVEHMWLPQWRDKASEDMLGDALLISYVFGLSENFLRLSRIAILNMLGPEFVQCEALPRIIKEKIAAVHRAKTEQVFEQCRETLKEYLPPDRRVDTAPHTTRQPVKLSIGLRCLREDEACDSNNLGWYMRTFASLGMLPDILQSTVLSPTPAPQTRSLLQIINSLCSVTSPPDCHGGICDSTPEFRAAILDIYKSVSGLTLLEVSGKTGWALSRSRSPRHSIHGHQNNNSVWTNEQLFKIAQQRYAPGDLYRFRSRALLPEGGVNDGHDNDDVCIFKILSLLDDPRDLRAAAMVNKRFYRNYLRLRLRHETQLREGIGRPVTRKSASATALHQMNIAEMDGTSLDRGSSRIAPSRRGEFPPREKFKLGQLPIYENKRLSEDDGNKYPGDIREPLLGPRIRGREDIVQNTYPFDKMNEDFEI
ncbi:hypothetical protein F4777DRAFT_526684 [Nemania sp. FL0916]|nr:hypothetical protein F4777DRAFT_526684 [Nemania sp. FL0916]